jgi:S-adenosylmethionine:tRNA ribosyltransferase-isomerase
VSIDVAPATVFRLPERLSAVEPPEAHGFGRDDVRLLVADGQRISHRRFRDLPAQLAAGDLVVVNTSKTLPAAVDASLPGGRPVVVHFATPMDDGTWVVEVRPPGRATGPAAGLAPGQRLLLAGGASARLLSAYPGDDPPVRRLWRTRVFATDVLALLHRHGRPIAYAYTPRRWPLRYYQTVFAQHPGSAEMPSAGRPFTAQLVTALVARGVRVAPVTLHTGVSSPEAGEPPLPERFEVPQHSADLVNLTRSRRGRVVAVGTTVTRALETVADVSGRVTAGSGWTDLVLGPDHPAQVVDAIITGWHAPGASHLLLLEAVAGAVVVAAAYEQALLHGYLWHEFGDSALLFRPSSRAQSDRPAMTPRPRAGLYRQKPHT